MVGRHLVYLSFALLSSPLPTGHVVSAAEAPSTITRPEMHSGTLSTRIQCLRLLMRPGLRRRAAALASMLPEPRPKPHRYVPSCPSYLHHTSSCPSSKGPVLLLSAPAHPISRNTSSPSVTRPAHFLEPGPPHAT
ncbi:hypothetical protein IWX49DRAFT_566070 [Phyllosticta citricarpa]|uniref:Secreted protein n=1 Tax=Phyllosticta citricarpa TaxID=55181 RepID=A0ABR1MDP9_9PEZI